MRKADFPIFHHHPNLLYLDSAASAQKPTQVIEAVSSFLAEEYANIGRGLYPLATGATERYEATRHLAAQFLGAQSPNEIIFTRNATHALNLVAQGLGATLQAGDEIILSTLEHHSNYLPWVLLAEKRGARVRTISVRETGEINLAELQQTLSEHTRLLVLSHCSNVLGTVTNIAQVRNLINEQGSGALLVLDASQSAPHFPIDVQKLGCDFLACSGHKLYGPSGTGILWGREELLAKLTPPEQGGGTVLQVTHQEFTWKEGPERFEAGTPAIEGTVGLGVALHYLQEVNLEVVAEHTSTLSRALQEELRILPEVTVLGTPDPLSGIVSFTVQAIHPHDIADLLGQQEICIRAGQHCAGPLHQSLNLAASCRVSFGLYNELADIERFTTALKEIISSFSN